MSTLLKLTVPEYDRMVETGAFDQLDRRIELIYGELHSMNPAGPVHDDYIGFLTQWSFENTRRKEVLVRIQCGLSLPDQESRPEPDVLWVKPRRYTDRHPESQDVLLLIEVSDSSIQFDRVLKSDLSAKGQIPEFWVVDVCGRCIHVHREPTEAGYSQVACNGVGSTIAPLIQPSAKLVLADLFSPEDTGKSISSGLEGG